MNNGDILKGVRERPKLTDNEWREPIYGIEWIFNRKNSFHSTGKTEEFLSIGKNCLLKWLYLLGMIGGWQHKIPFENPHKSTTCRSLKPGWSGKSDQTKSVFLSQVSVIQSMEIIYLLDIMLINRKGGENKVRLNQTKSF